MKKCPRCKEKIEDGATKCKHCQADLRNWFVRHKFWTVVIILIILGLIGNSAGRTAINRANEIANNTNQNSSSTTSSTKNSQTPTPTAPVDPNPHFGEGIYKVGTDIQAGTYRTRTASSGCYWERLAGFTGELSDIISNEGTDNPAIVTILPTDVGFSTHNCSTWTQDLSVITASQTSFGAGTYLVGIDIQPGTYKSQATDSCYWERLSGFSGNLKDILANDNAETSTIVTIKSTDKGFESHGCGTWTKQ